MLYIVYIIKIGPALRKKSEIYGNSWFFQFYLGKSRVFMENCKNIGKSRDVGTLLYVY